MKRTGWLMYYSRIGDVIYYLNIITLKSYNISFILHRYTHKTYVLIHSGESVSYDVLLFDIVRCGLFLFLWNAIYSRHAKITCMLILYRVNELQTESNLTECIQKKMLLKLLGHKVYAVTGNRLTCNDCNRRHTPWIWKFKRECIP